MPNDLILIRHDDLYYDKFLIERDIINVLEYAKKHADAGAIIEFEIISTIFKSISQSSKFYSYLEIQKTRLSFEYEQIPKKHRDINEIKLELNKRCILFIKKYFLIEYMMFKESRDFMINEELIIKNEFDIVGIL